MTKETKHLLKWWKEWLKRLLLTTYHIVNRRAYRKWKLQRDAAKYLRNNILDVDGMDGFDMFFTDNGQR